MNIIEKLAQQITILSCENQGDADAFQKELVQLLGNYNILPDDNNKGNIYQYIPRFIGAKRIEGLSQRTLDNYQLYLGKFAAAINKDIAAVTADDIRLYIGNLQMKESSVQTVLAILRSFFGWMNREELIVKNPMNKIPAVKKSSCRMRRAHTVEELERLRNACETVKEKALIEFLFSTGCRVSEICGIRLSDVDFSTRSVRVLGKGNSERLVYFSIKASLLLQAYIAQHKGGDMLFCNTRAPYGPISARSIQKIIHGIGVKAALLEPTHPHKLRHTMATIAHNNGMQITVLQRLLGHRQLSTTQIYASIDMSNVRYEHERYIS